MKKLALLLAALLLLSCFTGCGADVAGPSASESAAETVPVESAPVESVSDPASQPEPESTEEPEPEPEQKPAIEETVLMDASGIRVVAKSLEYIGEDAVLTTELTNNYGRDLYFNLWVSDVNGFCIRPKQHEGTLALLNLVKEGETMEYQFTLSASALRRSFIDTLAWLEITMSITVPNEFSSIPVDGDMRLEIAPAGSWQPPEFEGQVLYQSEEYTAIFLGVREDASEYSADDTVTTAYIYLENNYPHYTGVISYRDASNSDTWQINGQPAAGVGVGNNLKPGQKEIVQVELHRDEAAIPTVETIGIFMYVDHGENWSSLFTIPLTTVEATPLEQ